MSRDVSVGCKDGLLIRTAMLKGIQNGAGNVVIGAGNTFSEFYGNEKNFYIATSYYPTDNIVGWLLNGGGYGPLGNYFGLGID